jgi:ribosomal protein S6
MKKIIFIGILFLAGEVRSEETYLNCKWEYGRIVKENNIRLEKVVTKGDLGTNDYLVIIDFKNKKIIKSRLGSNHKVHNWGEKSINWHIELKQEKVSYIYNLDRISGRLEEIYVDTDNKDEIKHVYICDKTQKKF